MRSPAIRIGRSGRAAVLVATAPFLTAGAAARASGAQVIDTTLLARHARTLAHDSLAGRANGTAGQHGAVAYLERELERLGLEPAGDGRTFRQRLPLVRVDIDPVRTRLVVHRGASQSAFDTDAVTHFGGDSAVFRSFRGPVVYAGSAAEALSRLGQAPSLAGKVVVVTAGPPGSANTLADSLADRRAAGLLVILPDAGVLARLANARGRSRFFLAPDGEQPEARRPVPLLAGLPEIGRALGLDGIPASRLQSTPFLSPDATIEYSFSADFAAVEAANVVARLPGRDPALAREVVVVLAHYDHIGFAAPVDGDSLYNGFIDNAVGTSAVLAVAAALRETPLARSLIFLFTAAEEEGSLGSRHYAAHPPVPLGRTIAAINLDAGAPLAPPRAWILEGGGGTRLDSAARRVATRHGWTVSAEPARFSSDQWRFHERGVPSTLLVPGEGWEGLTPEQETQLIQRWWRAHRPDDEWEPAFPWHGLQRYALFAALVARELAGAPPPAR